jgi:O-antigen/teichoic acid export membrane protein
LKLYSRDRARRSLFDTIGFRALSQIATVLSYMVLVRSMSEEAFGVLNLLYAVIPIVNTLGSLGLDHVLRRYQPEYLSAGNTTASAWLLRSVRRLRLLSNIVLILVILVAWKWVAPWFELTPYRADFAVFSILIVLHFQILLLQYAMASQMQHRYSVGAVALQSFGKLVAYSTLAASGALTLRNAVYADLIAYGLSFACLWYGSRKTEQSAAADTYRPGGEELARVKRYALYSHLNDAASILQYSETDRFFIAALMNRIVVGTYAFYTRLTEMATAVGPQRLFDNIVQPLFFGVPRHEAREKIPRYFTFLINMGLIYQLPLITFTAVYHRDIVQVIFAGKFIEYSYLLPIVIAFSTIDNVFSIPIHLVAQYEEKASLIVKSQIVGFYQIAAMLTLVPLLGLLGAALASGSFHVFRNLFVWWHVRDDGVWLNFRAVTLSAALIWGATAAACILMRDALPLPAIPEMIFGMAACGVAALVYLRSPAICSSDRSILGNVLHGREGGALRWLGLLPRSAS